jgi:hypothetical protein
LEPASGRYDPVMETTAVRSNALPRSARPFTVPWLCAGGLLLCGVFLAACAAADDSPAPPTAARPGKGSEGGAARATNAGGVGGGSGAGAGAAGQAGSVAARASGGAETGGATGATAQAGASGDGAGTGGGAGKGAAVGGQGGGGGGGAGKSGGAGAGAEAGAGAGGAAVPSCSDEIRNGSETDVDCGGSCPGCVSGDYCDDASDCLSGICSSLLCAEAGCVDGVQNGTESDVDCGGLFCAPCARDHLCILDDDCWSKICELATCVQDTCTDGKKNGLESDVDCGWGCSSCADGQSCEIDFDCKSELCQGGQCQAPTCTDGAWNGTETQKDCGGNCPACTTCANTATIEWGASVYRENGECIGGDVGYELYRGTAKGAYDPAYTITLPPDDPDLHCEATGLVGECGSAITCSYESPPLANGTWFWGMASFDANGLFSQRVSVGEALVIDCP